MSFDDIFGNDKREYETPLYAQIIDILNKKGFHFRDTNDGKGKRIDLTELNFNGIAEVKLRKAEEGAFQILHKIVVTGKFKEYIYLFDSYMMYVFTLPEKEKVVDFVKKFDSNLSQPSSKYSGKYIKEALSILGEPLSIISWRNSNLTANEILGGINYIDITEDNIIPLIHETCSKCGIKTHELLFSLSEVNKKHRIMINNVCMSIMVDDKEPIILKHNGNLSESDIFLFTKLRIENYKILKKIAREVEQHYPKERIIERGAHYTSPRVSKEVAEYDLSLRPSVIYLPCEGGGAFANAEQATLITNNDIIKMNPEELLPPGDNLVTDLNPGFYNKKGKKLPRKMFLKKNIPVYLHKYGTDCQYMPLVGNIIEAYKVDKTDREKHLNFFAPAGLILGKKGHQKMLNELLNNYTFERANISRGSEFTSTIARKRNTVTEWFAISRTCWRYGGSTKLEDIEIYSDGEKEPLRFKIRPILTDYYDFYSTDFVLKEIAMGTGNTPDSMFGGKVIKEIVIPDKNKGIKGNTSWACDVSLKRVKKMIPELENIGIATELACMLINTGISASNMSALIDYHLIPIAFCNADTIVPDFRLKESIEILSIFALALFIKKTCASGRVGFVGPEKEMRCGTSGRLNDGIRNLFRITGDVVIGEKTIDEILIDVQNDVKSGNRDSKKYKKLRKLLKNEAHKRLLKIGYWDSLPMPKEYIKHDSQIDTFISNGEKYD